MVIRAYVVILVLIILRRKSHVVVCVWYKYTHFRAWVQNSPSLVCPYLPMQEYFEQFPQENGSIFLFNAYTGEAIYDVDRWGSPLPDAHKLSHWFEPTAMVPPLNFEDSPPSRVDIGDVSSNRAEAVVSG